jgi:uncharacterized repeat protein (TIGR01451 family)
LGDDQLSNTEIAFYAPCAAFEKAVAPCTDGSFLLGRTPVVAGIATYTISADMVPKLAIGDLTFSAGWGGNGLYNEPPKATAPYEIVGPDLEMGIFTSSKTPAVGDIIRVDFKVRNIGNADAHNAVAKLKIPAGLTLVHNAMRTLSTGYFDGDDDSEDYASFDWATGVHWVIGPLPFTPVVAPPLPTSLKAPMNSAAKEATPVIPWQQTASVYVLVTDTGPYAR